MEEFSDRERLWSPGRDARRTTSDVDQSTAFVTTWYRRASRHVPAVSTFTVSDFPEVVEAPVRSRGGSRITAGSPSATATATPPATASKRRRRRRGGCSGRRVGPSGRGRIRSCPRRRRPGFDRGPGPVGPVTRGFGVRRRVGSGRRNVSNEAADEPLAHAVSIHHVYAPDIH